MNKKQILGTWKLVSFVYTADDGSSFYPYGKIADGILFYDASGYMCAVITRKDRPHMPTEDFGLLPDHEKISLAKGFMTYTGKYEIQEGQILHNIEIGYFPNWAGTTFVRYPFLEGSNLVLATPPISLRGKCYTGYLTWQRP